MAQIWDTARSSRPAVSEGEHLRFKVGEELWSIEPGRLDSFGTAAYWIEQARRCEVPIVPPAPTTSELIDETVFCLLGGFGVSAEAAGAAFDAVVGAGLVHDGVTSDEIEIVLAAPFEHADGRSRKYRFPHQRAARIADALHRFGAGEPPVIPLELRAWLCTFNGIGPKTASWIVRNVTQSNEVAIVDIWLIRALTACGVFRTHWRVDRHYNRYESAFLQYANQGDVLAGVLDLCVWEQARRAALVPTLAGAFTVDLQSQQAS